MDRRQRRSPLTSHKIERPRAPENTSGLTDADLRAVLEALTGRVDVPDSHRG